MANRPFITWSTANDQLIITGKDVSLSIHQDQISKMQEVLHSLSPLDLQNRDLVLNMVDEIQLGMALCLDYTQYDDVPTTRFCIAHVLGELCDGLPMDCSQTIFNRTQLYWTLANLIYHVTEIPRRALYTPMRTPLAECMQQLSPTLSTTTSDSILYIPERYMQIIETKLYLVPNADVYSCITQLLVDTYC
jgi:hypothetical protein